MNLWAIPSHTLHLDIADDVACCENPHSTMIAFLLLQRPVCMPEGRWPVVAAEVHLQ